MEFIKILSATGILCLTTIIIVSLMSQFVNGLIPLAEFQDKCLILLPGNLCDIIFDNTSNGSNSRYLTNFSALTYNDKNFEFTIQYPLGWDKDEGNREFNSVVRFVPPQNDADVDIRIFPKGDYNSIDEYGDTFKDSTRDYKMLSYYRNSSTTLSDRPALRATYLTTYNASVTGIAYDNKSSPLKEMTVSTMVPERESIYSISYFAKPNAFDNYLPVVEKMINSFKIYGKVL
jgi:hypothetical protein